MTQARAPLVSILIPTLDEQRELPALLDALGALHGRWEIVVADGGSRDATVTLARTHATRPRVIVQRGGRAVQLNAAARAATGDMLLFLHADSRLPRDAYASLAQAWRTPGLAGGNFALAFGGDGAFERALGAVYRFQRRHGYYYGDSSLWVRRDMFDALGGFREIPIMDDYDFVRRLERGSAPRAACPAPRRRPPGAGARWGSRARCSRGFSSAGCTSPACRRSGSRGCTGPCAEPHSARRMSGSRLRVQARRRSPPAGARRSRRGEVHPRHDEVRRARGRTRRERDERAQPDAEHAARARRRATPGSP